MRNKKKEKKKKGEGGNTLELFDKPLSRYDIKT